MWPFRTYRRSAQDVHTIERLRAECLRLKKRVIDLEAYKRKIENKERKRKARDQAKTGIKQFIKYRNYRTIARQFWPKVLCSECAHSKNPRTGNGRHYCQFHRLVVGKFGSCQNALQRRIELEAEEHIA